ncbi:hypothetical protein D3C72_961890 [compost metagenome]
MSSGSQISKAMTADLMISSFVLEFGYFEEFVLDHVFDAIADRLIDPSVEGSHNWRVLLALGQLNSQLALAIQAMWETHFRRWLRACAVEAHGDDREGANIKRLPIDRLDKHLLELRGVRLTDMPGGSALRELVLVGNVVRHGDGPSAALLVATAQDIWRTAPTIGEGTLSEENADKLIVSDARLKQYAEAVQQFWFASSRAVHATFEDPPWATEPSIERSDS